MNFAQAVRACSLCQELAQDRTNVVIGDGPVPCKLVFLGEAPGKVEDEKGIPFIGAAGEHLRTLIYLLHLSADEYHILNVLKCRPPGNRDPKIQELENCRPFLLHQLQTLRPKVILAMGRFAQAFALQQSPTGLHVVENAGKIVTVNELYDTPLKTKVMLTYHPSFVLRNRYNDVEKAFRQHLRKGKRIAYG